MALQLAAELRATGSQAGDDGVDVFDGECDSLLLAVRAVGGRVQRRRSDPREAGVYGVMFWLRWKRLPGS
jgi:hypothetical protein